MYGEILQNTPKSLYQPSQEIADLTRLDQQDYFVGFNILHKPWNELNDYSVIDRMNKDQRTFNSFVDESVEDPNEAWKWRGTRSMARNRAMAMHAQITADYIIPGIFAQNEGQQEDEDAEEVMHLITEWMITNSSYKSSFVLVAMGMLVNPVTYLGAEYNNVYQKIKEKNAQGYALKEVVDEVLSGFQCPVYSADQILITNAHEQNIQKQRKIIKRKFIEYTEAEAKYKDCANWGCVTPGIKAIYNQSDGLFYDIKDYVNPNLVEECITFDRQEDCEIPYINGIYMGEENTEGNMIKHRDNYNAPKYNVTPFGYERINEHFYYYKSLINRVGWDDKLYDAMYELTMNRAILDTDSPNAYSGIDKMDSGVIAPGVSIASADPNFKVTPLLPPSSGSSYHALDAIERSISDASISDLSSGKLPHTPIRPTTAAILQQNAKILLDSVRKSLGHSVEQYGQLMIDIALQHLTVPEVEEITGGMTYRQFVLSSQLHDGKKVSKRVNFDQSMMAQDMSEKDIEMHAMQNLEDVGYPNNKEILYNVNPYIFSKLKYMVRIDYDNLEPKNREFEKVMAERLYQLLRQDPLIEPQALVRKLIHSYYRSGTEELMAKNPQQIMGGNPVAGQLGNPAQPGFQSKVLPALTAGVGMK